MANTNTKDKTRFIIVDSVKGGCGKTTDALAVAIDNAAKKRKETQGAEISQEDRRADICLIDMDILGTSMERLIMGGLFVKANKHLREEKDGTEADKEKEKYNKVYKWADQYLNDLVSTENPFLGDYKTGIELDVDSEHTCDIDFIISSPYERDRRKFRVSGNSNYTMQITPTHFRGVIKKLIERLMDEGYKTIVFDMPPNSDVYTDCVFDILLNTEYRDSKEGDIESVELRIVSTLDRSHIYANKDWLSIIYEGRDHHWKKFDKIYFVLNNNSIRDLTHVHMIKGLTESVRDDITINLPASIDKETIGFLYRQYNENLIKHFLFGGPSEGKPLSFDGVENNWRDVTEVELKS